VSVRINTNIEALDAQRNLSMTATTFAKSVEKLSSGLRINRAADDAAGLAISQKLGAQVTGLNQAQRNAQDGISMVQTAEGALNEVHSMLQRIRELAVEASNSTLSSEDAASVSTEITALRDEINRIAGATTFNGQHLLTGSLSVSQASGLAAGDNVGAAVVGAVDVSGAKGSTTYTLTSSTSGGKDYVTLDDGAGHMQQLEVMANAQTLNFDTLGVKVTLTGTDTAANIAGALDTAQVVTGAGTDANFQIGANAGDFLQVSFADATISASGYGSWNADITAFASATSTGTGIIAAAQALITSSDDAIGYISTTRGNLGAVQNRLEHTTASISVASENLNASQSRIRDLDVASEMVNFTKTQILQQAGTAILAQANQAPQNILQLLR
jgi:flagellin